MTDLSKRLAKLSPEQRALLEKRLEAQKKEKKKDKKVPSKVVIPKRTGDGPWPASIDQATLWFFHQLNPETTIYNIGNGYRLRGRLNLEIFQKSLDAIAMRHEILRTTFQSIDGKPYQVIHDKPNFGIEIIDVRHEPEDVRWKVAQEKLGNCIRRPLDMEKGPLTRIALVRLADNDQVISCVLHHAVTDWWSYQIFFREQFQFYEAFMRGVPPTLPDVTIQYADWAQWRNEWEKGPECRKMLDYWLDKLKNADMIIELPTDFARPPIQTGSGRRCFFTIPEELNNKVRQINRQFKTTMVMPTLATAFAFLSRWAGVENVIMGMASTNRDFEGAENMFGYLLNILPMYGDLSGDPTFREFLGQVRTTVLESFENKDLPFRQLVEALNPPRDLSRSHVYQTEFVYVTTEDPATGTEPVPTALMKRLGLEMGGFPIDRHTTAVDVQISFLENPGGMGIFIEYCNDLFKEETIERMGSMLVSFMNNLCDYLDTPISKVPMVSAVERKSLLRDFNQTAADYPREANVVDLFEQQVADGADAVAAVYGDQSLSYGELDARANRLAHYLREQGVGVGTPVGISMVAGFDMLAAVLATLKVGCYYVPLDVSYPAERITLMVEDTGMAALITTSELSENLPANVFHFINVIELDQLEYELEEMDSSAPGLKLDAQLPAYIIYTSGSTGTPKGVMVNHRAIVRLVRDTNYVDLGRNDIVAQLSNISFDAMTFEMWGALLNGARIQGIPRETALSPADMAAFLGENKVTAMFMTTALFNQVISEKKDAFDKLTWLLVGGEAVSPEHMAMALGDHGPQHLTNIYGPTESTTFAIYHRVTAVEPKTRAVPIGLPIANTTAYVVDRYLEPQPITMAGEVLLGGDGLAFGYHRRPALTANVFIPNPFSDKPGERLYRTGDLAIRNSKGEMAYFGRIDKQVKIRGFRVEPGEIRAALMNHAAVNEAIVVPRSTGDHLQLVAYLAIGENDCDLDDVRTQIRQTLPDYMVPALFVTLPEMPLTPNGKVDHKALPNPDEEAQVAHEHIEPRNEAEQKMAAIWRKILGREQIGVTDNFFELGGDSLLSIQVKALASKEGLDFELHDLFEFPTIEHLVRGAAGGTGEQFEPVEPFALISEEDRARLPEGLSDAYPASRLQVGMLYHGDMDKGSTDYHDIISYELQVGYDGDVLRDTIELICNRHEILRTGFDLQHFSVPLQLVHENARIPISYRDLRGEAEPDKLVQALVEKEVLVQFDWSEAPLMRLFVDQYEDDRIRLTFSFHHAIIDGWSEATFVTELISTYMQMLRGETIELPELHTRYADFIALETAALSSEATQTFWDETLSDAPVLSIPGTPTAKENAHLDQGWVVIDISEETSVSLRNLANHLGVPLKSVLLSAHLKTLSAISDGSSDIVSGLVSNGRPETTGSERTLGLFLNTIPLRANLQSGSWENLVREVFAAERALMPHRRYPLPDMMQAHGGKPLYQAAFNFTHFHAFDDLENEGMRGSASERVGFTKTSIPILGNFDVNNQDPVIRAVVGYNPVMYCEADGQRFAACYARVLAKMGENPRANHAKHDFLADADRKALELLNATPAGKAGNADMAQRVSDAAAQHGDALALHDEQGTVSYAVLDSSVQSLAATLAAHGVGRESIVALLLPPGRELIGAVLATVRAGGTYLPLDGETPAERMSFILADAEPTLIVTCPEWRDAMTAVAGDRQLLVLDDALPAGASDWTAPANDPDQALYVTYTSGTTGLPKGVVISHQNVADFVDDTSMPHYAPGDVVGQFSNPAFDAFTMELWDTLSGGATLALVPRDSLLDAQPLAAQIETKGINGAFITASLFDQLVRTDATLFKGFRKLWFGGQQANPDTIRTLLAGDGPEALLNGYGPTETTTFAAVHAVRELDDTAAYVPVGKPMSGMAIQVLGHDFQPVATGVSGHVHLAGAGLARGYFKRPALTSAAFVPDPFSKVPGGRLYRTGDLGRYDAQGTLTITGRADRQVKLRGYRIELGEIEHALRAHDAVEDAVVVMSGDRSDTNFLSAFVVSADAELGNSLAEFLTHQVPTYMVPSRFTVVERFPLTSRGKTDLRALRSLEAAAEAASYTAPRNETEETVAAIWAELLQLEKVDIHTDFFSLGAHSLTLTRAIARLREELELDLPIKALLEHPTVADLCEHIAALREISGFDDDDEDFDEEGEI